MRNELTFWLTRLNRAYHTIAWEELQEHGYYPVQEWLMLELLDRGKAPAPFSRLVKNLAMSEASLSRMIGRLAEGGMVETAPHPSDSREVLVRASHLARVGEAPLRHAVAYIEDCMWASLPPSDHATFYAIMRRAGDGSSRSAQVLQRNRLLTGRGIAVGHWNPRTGERED